MNPHLTIEQLSKAQQLGQKITWHPDYINEKYHNEIIKIINITKKLIKCGILNIKEVPMDKKYV